MFVSVAFFLYFDVLAFNCCFVCLVLLYVTIVCRHCLVFSSFVILFCSTSLVAFGRRGGKRGNRTTFIGTMYNTGSDNTGSKVAP